MILIVLSLCLFFFFFNDTATTEIYTLSLTTLFRSLQVEVSVAGDGAPYFLAQPTVLTVLVEEKEVLHLPRPDRKSTRLNSSHMSISYAVFCLKKKKKKNKQK